MPLAQPFAQHLAQPLAQPLDGGASQFDPLLRHIIRTVGARRVVLVTALPGTQACVATRAALTSQLIADFGFAGVVVATPTASEATQDEGLDLDRLDRFVRADPGCGGSVEEALAGASWRWRNHEVARWLVWLRDRNASHRPDERAGIGGERVLADGRAWVVWAGSRAWASRVGRGETARERDVIVEITAAGGEVTESGADGAPVRSSLQPDRASAGPLGLRRCFVLGRPIVVHHPYTRAVRPLDGWAPDPGLAPAARSTPAGRWS